jgi:hypothetical protein
MYHSKIGRLTSKPTVEAAEAATTEAAPAEPAAAETAGAHASPTAETVGPGCPAASAPEAIAKATERVLIVRIRCHREPRNPPD